MSPQRGCRTFRRSASSLLHGPYRCYRFCRPRVAQRPGVAGANGAGYGWDHTSIPSRRPTIRRPCLRDAAARAVAPAARALRCRGEALGGWTISPPIWPARRRSISMEVFRPT